MPSVSSTASGSPFGESSQGNNHSYLTPVPLSDLLLWWSCMQESPFPGESLWCQKSHLIRLYFRKGTLAQGRQSEKHKGKTRTQVYDCQLSLSLMQVLTVATPTRSKTQLQLQATLTHSPKNVSPAKDGKQN